ANVFRIDQIERTGLRGQHPGIAQPAECQRSKTTRIAHRDQLFWGQEEHREAAFSSTQNLRNCIGDRRGAGTSDAMQHHFSVRSRGEDRAFAFKLSSFVAGKWQVAVVANSNLSMLASHQKWLRLANRNLARCRVAYMADGANPLESVKTCFI